MKYKRLAVKLSRNFGQHNYELSLYDGLSFFNFLSSDLSLSPTEQSIVKSFEKSKGDFLIPEICQFIGQPDFPKLFYVSDFTKPQELTLKEVKEWELAFLFDSFDGYNPLFRPTILPKEDSENSLSLKKDFTQNYFYTINFDQENGLVSLLNRSRSLDEMIKRFKSPSLLETKEVREAEEFFMGEGVNTREFFYDFDFTEQNCQPILEISQVRRGELHLILQFDYEGTLLPFKNEEETIILNQTEDQISFSRRDLVFEQAICSRCLFTFGREVHTKIFGAVRHYNFALTMEESFFIETYGQELLDFGILLKRKKDKKPILGRGKVAFRIIGDGDWLEIEALISMDQHEDRVELNTALLNQNFVAGQKGLYLVSPEDIEQLKTLSGLGLGKEGVIKTCSSNMGMIDLITPSILNGESETLARIKELEEQLTHIDMKQPIPISTGFKGVLRDYQQAGVNWLHFLHNYGLNGCLADDMGLGKTVQTLAFLQNLYESGELRRVLVVAPVSTLPNWELEIKRFLPHINLLRHFGSNRTSSTKELEKPTITLISYQTLRNDIKRFKKITYSYVILDEAQYIKNASSQVFKSVRTLSSERRLSLTGTPVENKIMDLWSQMDFLNPGLLGQAKQFQMRFIKPIEEEKCQDKTEQLKKIVYPFILRRKKKDVLKDLPPRSEIVRYMEMGPDQAALYNKILAQARGELFKKVDEKGVSGARMDILQALMKLRQVALFPGMISPEYENISSSKFDVLKLHLRDITEEGNKVLIFSQFVKSLTYIREWLDDEKLDYSYLDGSTRDRQSEIERFQEDPQRQIFLISLKAGGTGINLTAANYVMIFDPWWNPAIEAQAIDRTHRIGQTRQVTAFRLIMKGTIEEKMLALQKKKIKLVDNLITTEDSIFKEMTRGDLDELFQLT